MSNAISSSEAREIAKELREFRQSIVDNFIQDADEQDVDAAMEQLDRCIARLEGF